MRSSSIGSISSSSSNLVPSISISNVPTAMAGNGGWQGSDRGRPVRVQRASSRTALVTRFRSNNRATMVAVVLLAILHLTLAKEIAIRNREVPQYKERRKCTRRHIDAPRLGHSNNRRIEGNRNVAEMWLTIATIASRGCHRWWSPFDSEPKQRTTLF